MTILRTVTATGVITATITLCAAIAQTPGRTIVPEDRYYGTGIWNADSLGNHRAVLRVRANAPAVRAFIPWRRRDRNPAQKGAIVIDATTGTRISNVRWITVNREHGDLLFQPLSAPGEYYVYYLLYRAKGSRNYPKGYYLPMEQSADTSWLREIESSPSSLQHAELVQFQTIDSLNAFYPMEVIATQEEMATLLRKEDEAPFLLFPEDRLHPIRMTADLPYRWIARGPGGILETSADRGEFFSFQVGVFASRGRLRDLTVTMSDLRNGKGEIIKAPPLPCFNTGGKDWTGKEFRKSIAVEKGTVQPLWMGIQIDPHATPGRYEGTVSVSARDVQPQTVRLSLHVSAKTVKAAGDDDPARLTRLRWLNSTLAIDDSLVHPYVPVTRSGNVVSCLGRSLALNATGLPSAVRSYFTPDVTAIGRRPREILASPARFVIEDSLGKALSWKPGRIRFTQQAPGIVRWHSQSQAGPLEVTVEGQLECDGFADFRVALRARSETAVTDIRLELPLALDVARYMMGMGVRGGTRPSELRWKWDVQKNQDALWLGDVNAGVQVSFRAENYERPLNTNFYLSKPLRMPPSWYNEGQGGVSFARAEERTLLLRSFSGHRGIHPNETLHFNFSFLITPFRTIDTDAQWATRYYHKFAPIDQIAETGANTVNVHHATEINPFINYPFLRPDAMRSYVKAAHDRGVRLKIYYTVRELSNRAPELFALRSLGSEVLSDGPGGGFSWLQEHVDSNYIAAWFVPDLKDAAVINSGVSRWHNYYVEGLQWLVRNVGIDGLYIDDVAFDRTTMKRVRKVLQRGRPSPLIDLHSANQFNPRDGFANSANLYMEHFPYIDRLWFGEYFDYDSRPDFWLVEVSGIPFGLMGEMLEKGGNPWRGMIYGMTARLPWAGDPRPVWRVWDEFGLKGSRMIGYWSPFAPVRTDNPDILATTYVKKGKALIALASWAPETTDCLLTFDWEVLGIDPSKATLFAPGAEGFQSERAFRRGETIRLEPGKGWLLLLSERN